MWQFNRGLKKKKERLIQEKDKEMLLRTGSSCNQAEYKTKQ